MKETTSFFSAIKNEVNSAVASKIEDTSYKSSIYVLYICDITEVKQKTLDAKFASYHVKYPDRSYESFMKQLKDRKEDKYNFIVEPQGYFIDEETAVDYAIKNIGDINEAGSYPYVIISSMPLNRVCPTANTRKHRLFLFNRDKEIYEEIDWDHSEATKFLLYKGERGLF